MKGPIKGAQWSSAWIFGSSATWQGTSSVFNIPPTHKNTHVRFSCVTYIAITKPRGFRRFTCLRFVLHGPPPNRSSHTRRKIKTKHDTCHHAICTVATSLFRMFVPNIFFSAALSCASLCQRADFRSMPLPPKPNRADYKGTGQIPAVQMKSRRGMRLRGNI